MAAYFTIGDVYTRVSAPANILAKIKTICKARPDGFQYIPKYRSGSWDGYISLMQSLRYMPTGLLPDAARALQADGIKCLYDSSKIVSIQPIEDAIATCLFGITLRDYQVEAVETLLQHGRGIAKMATNSGKTAVFAALIMLLECRDSIIVVQSKDLLYQTQERLASYLGRDVGLVGDSHRDDTDVCVATIQTLMSMRNRMGRVQFKDSLSDNRILVVDECHHVAHNETFDVLMDVPGWHRFGMSGTPLDRGALNDLKLIACTGPVRTEITNQDLIQAEWSAKPIIHMMDYEQEASPEDDYWESSYAEAYKTCIVENDGRNRAIVDLAKSEVDRKHSVLIIVTRIEHGHRLMRMMNSSVPAAFVNGSSPVTVRQEALRRLDSTACVVIATNIFDEGVDIPALDAVVLACGGLSHIKLLQRIGRGLRSKDGDNVVHIYDMLDGCNKYLIEHVDKRLDVYEQEGFKVEYNGHS